MRNIEKLLVKANVFPTRNKDARSTWFGEQPVECLCLHYVGLILKTVPFFSSYLRYDFLELLLEVTDKLVDLSEIWLRLEEN